MSEHVLRAALALACDGLAVLPCRPSKEPNCPRGYKDASSDLETVRRLWRDHPGPLIGVATGAVSGISALDIDRKHASAQAWFKANRHRLPVTRTHRTRSGGLHLLLKHNVLVRCTVAKLALGVDTRASGGFVIWWPAAGLPVLRDAPPAEWPEWIVSEFRPKPRMEIFRPGERITFGGSPGRRGSADSRLDGLARKVAGTPEGERNAVLFWAACRAGELVRAGKVAMDMARSILVDAARRAGLSYAEAERTVISGIERGKGD